MVALNREGNDVSPSENICLQIEEIYYYLIGSGHGCSLK